MKLYMYVYSYILCPIKHVDRLKGVLNTVYMQIYLATSKWIYNICGRWGELLLDNNVFCSLQGENKKNNMKDYQDRAVVSKYCILVPHKS